MSSTQADTPNRWTEDTSRRFLDFGRYFVPERERQMHIITRLVPGRDQPFHIIELCCGGGLLAETLLEAYPSAHLLGLDGSQEMLNSASQRLARIGNRFQSQTFDLAAKDWRRATSPAAAVVSSLAIHHLTGPEKLELFRDVYSLLEPGGVFVVADVMEHNTEAARRLAADELDEAIRQRSLWLDGNTEGFAFFEREQWNMYRFRDDDDIDKPSTLFEQLKWLEEAAFVDIDVHWLSAGHAIFSGRRSETQGP
jgi:tRNA (cmo5U34)-methyltransferase